MAKIPRRPGKGTLVKRLQNIDFGGREVGPLCGIQTGQNFVQVTATGDAAKSMDSLCFSRWSQSVA
ncbi:MAG: hypothetical protein HIU83_02060 [Proteobacteria bacterium]|nr:hypothetical protein [Pseudomonadota bacterium]